MANIKRDKNVIKTKTGRREETNNPVRFQRNDHRWLTDQKLISIRVRDAGS